MQPELKTDFPMITHQPGNTAIGSKVGSSQRNNEVKSQDKCFLGMLCDVEKTPHENIIDLEKLQENNHNGENITSVLLGVEQNSYGNEEKPLIPMIAETDKNTTATASKPEIELSLKKSAPG
ncbi:MAG: hypothetical protein KJO26_13050, partial [Deltaproteobacteria bacterium]|nr:hypothetical protein [Deltaproteobacteria bacterium]